MKTIKILSIITLTGLLFFTSCGSDDEGQGPGVELFNCDDTGCDTKSCATLVSLTAEIVCNIVGDDDIDWYKVEVSQADVDNNFGVYAFNFINLSDNTTFEVSLFEDGVAAGDVSVTGNGDLTYEPDEDVTGGIQFFAPGTFYLSIQKSAGTDNGLYEIQMY